jgi:hypothetical protein
MAEEDVFRAAGLGSADESEDEPAIERPNGDTSQAGAVWSDSLGAPEAGTEEVPDDSDPAAVDTDRGGSADLGKTSDALKAAGLDDSDDEGGEEPGGAPEGDDDHADQLGEAPTEELPKPGAVQRLSGPPQVRISHLISLCTNHRIFSQVKCIRELKWRAWRTA